MSYYIGSTGTYIWEELLENATSNVVIANNINFDAGPLTDAIQQTITDTLGTAVGELIAPITEVPSATGVGVVALTALGLLSYYKLNRTAVQDVDSMVYSADYASILTPGMFDDRVRIRYDSNQFSNAFYYEGGVKKGEILTSRLNLLPVDSNNVDIYTLTGKVGIGITSPSTQLHLYATNNILRLQTAPVDGTNSIEFVRGSTTDPLNDYRLHTDTTGKFKLQYSTNALAYGGTGSDLIHISPTNINIYKDTEITGNVGIGTTPATQFHSYHATDNIMRLGTATNGKVSIEFVRGTIDDVYNDFRLINQAGVFTLQYENNLLAYGNTGTDLISASSTQISLGKNTEISGNVGIGTAINGTYKLDVNGTVNATAFRGDGSAITGLNQDNLTLTTTKLYQNFNTTNFAIIDNLIDLPPNYSFTITGYDSQTLFPPSADRKYKGRMSCSYDDRNGVYKLLTTENKTDNVAVLQYKVGDKISIRNLANPKVDYLEYNGFKYFNSLVLYKRPSNKPLDWNNIDAFSVGMYEWRSSDGISIPEATVYTLPLGNRTYPFTTVITFIIETGFNYYLAKLYNRTNTSGGNVFVEATGYGDDFNDFNRAFGAGQTFRLQTGTNFSPSDYQPKFYVPPKLEIGSVAQVGGVKPRRGLEINAETGDLDAVPLSSDLITNMNTSQFVNNTGTSKIDISSSYVAPNATKLATARNIAGVSFDGSGAIDIPYANLTNKPTIPAAQVSSDWTAVSGVSMILNKPSLFSGSYTDLTNKPTIPAAQVSSDWNAVSGVSMILNKPSLFSGSYNDLTNKPTIPAAQVSSDWTAVSGVSMILNKPSLFSGSYTDLTNKPTIPAAQVSSDWTAVSGVSMILNKPSIPAAQVNSDWNAVSGLAQILNKPTLITMTDINNTSNYTTRINSQLTTAIAATQPKIISTAGQIIIGNGDGITTTSTGLTWTTDTLNATNLTTTNTLTTPNLAVSTQATITQLLTAVGGTLGTDMFSLVNNATNSLRFAQVYIGANDMKWLLIQKTNNVDNTIFNFRNGKIAIGTFSNPAYMIDLVGDINITGNYRVNSTIYKPANAVLADTATTATKLATARYIAGVLFDGSGDIAIDYFSLNNKPIILQPTTTNLQLVSGYTLSIPSNVGVGTTAIATNVLQVGSGARLRIANNATDYTIIGTNDTDGATNTQIIISGNTRATNAGNIQYVSTATNGSHLFYTTATSIRMTISSAGVNINNDLGVTGNVGIGTAPSATYKVNVNGTLNATNVLIGGNAITGSKWSNGSVATNIYYNLGNVGIGASTTSDVDDNTAFAIPTATLFVKGGATAGGTCDVVIRGGVAGQNNGKARLWLSADASHSSYIESGHTGNGNTYLTFGTSIGNVLPAERMFIGTDGCLYINNNNVENGSAKLLVAGSDSAGTSAYFYHPNRSQGIGITYDGLRGLAPSGNQSIVMRPIGSGSFSVEGNQYVSGTSYMRNTYIYSGNEGSSIGLYFSTPFYGTPTSANKSAIIAQAISNYSRHHLAFCLNSDQNNGTNVDLNNVRLRINADGYVEIFTNLYLWNGASYYGGFYSVSSTNTDYLCIQNNTSINTTTSNWIRVAYGTFTGFHRCYTDDELYNNDTDESIDLFKNNYMGRVVIATGKIKTDFSRKQATEPEPNAETNTEPNAPTNDIQEWYSGIDKDGISIEDAVPVVALSRQRKDKRVFGVLGEPKRSTNNKDRLIVNSVGEGAICVSNTNGNIENGDLLQTSDLLGYAEKQDDDIIRSYTIGKATIDCNFELDSQYYQCHEIENGVRVAFIACSYHCG